MPFMNKQRPIFLDHELPLILFTALLAAIVLLTLTPMGDALGAP